MSKIVPIYAIQEIIAEADAVVDTPFQAHLAANEIASSLDDEDFTEVYDIHGGITGEYAFRNVKFTKAQKERYTEILNAAFVNYIAEYISLNNLWNLCNAYFTKKSFDMYARFYDLTKNPHFKADLKARKIKLWPSVKTFEKEVFKNIDYQETLRLIPYDMQEDFINLAFAYIPDVSQEELDRYYNPESEEPDDE